MEVRNLVLLIIFLFVTSIMAIEEPEYKVLEEHDDIELREYSSFLVAEVTIKGSFEEAGNKAFRSLFNYIDGKNSKQQSIEMTAPVNQEQIQGEKIEMTAPVNQQQIEEGAYRVSFVMPSRFTMETLPKPLNPNVKLREIPIRKVAVIRYSGTWSEENYSEHAKELFDFLNKNNHEIVGEPIWSRYNAPFMPWFLRRNEIMVEIK